MGLILGRFRKKKTTLEQLEKLDADIKSIEAFRLNTELAQRRIVGQFILVSAGIYVVVAIVFYFQFFPATFYDQLFYITPLLLVPFIIWGVKRLLTWYYRRKIINNDTTLSKLRSEKKKLLDHVMDTETYKVAKGILEKFAPDQIRKSPISFELTPFKSTNLTNTSNPTVIATPAFRNRVMPPKTPGPLFPMTPSAPAAPMAFVTNRMLQSVQTPGRQGPGTNGQQPMSTALQVRSPSLPLPREILPRDRSILDKMVEYLVGDGPGNRFALICKNCHGHNGMALPEEFEYFSFRCCYCFVMNPARKLRPHAPKLELEAPSSSPERQRKDSTSSSERISGSDSEVELPRSWSKSGEGEARDRLPTPVDDDDNDDIPKEVEQTPDKTEEEKKTD